MEEFRKVMLVDDDDDVRQLAEMALTQLGGLTVHACESGEAALAQLEVFRPQLILLDANMPGLDGPETLAEIQRNADFGDIPIVFITGESRSEEVQRLKDLGATGVIVKPFDPMTLSDQVKQIGQQPSE